MGSGIGTISIDFDANVAKFVTNTDKATGSVTKFGQNAKAHKGAADDMFGKLAGAELFAAGIEKAVNLAGELASKMIEVVAHTMEEVEAADKLAKSFGISTASLLSLQAAAKLAGNIDADAFNSSLEHMTAQLGEASMKGGEVQEALEAIGLDAKKLHGEAPDAAFREIAHALGDVSNAADRAALAKTIFGKAGAADMPLFGKALDEAEAKARRFGVAMSEADVSKIAVADEEIESLGLQFKGIGNQITAFFAPSIGEAAKLLSSMLSTFTDVDEANQKAAEHLKQENVAKAFADETLKASASIKKTIADLNKEIGTIGMSDADKKIYELHQQFKLLSPEMWQGVHAAEALAKKLDALKKHDESAGKLADAFASVNAEIAQIGMSDADKKVFEIGEKFRDLSPELQKQIPILQELQREANRALTFGKVEEEIGKLNRELAEGGDAVKKFDDRLRDMGATQEQVGRADGLKKQVDAMNEAVEKQKKDLEDVKHLAEEGLTPLQKRTEMMEKMNRLLDEHKISQEQFDRAKRKADEEFRGKGGGHENVAAITRRFDFKMPGNRTSKEPTLEVQEKQLSVAVAGLQFATSTDKNIKKISDTIGGVADLN